MTSTKPTRKKQTKAVTSTSTKSKDTTSTITNKCPTNPEKVSQWIENQDSKDVAIKHGFIFSGLDDDSYIEHFINQIHLRVMAKTKLTDKLQLWDLIEILSTQLVGNAALWFEHYVMTLGTSTLEQKLTEEAIDEDHFTYKGFLKAFRDKFKKPEHLQVLQVKLGQVKQDQQSFYEFKQKFNEVLNLFTPEERESAKHFIVETFRNGVNRDYAVIASVAKTLDDIYAIEETPEDKLKRTNGTHKSNNKKRKLSFDDYSTKRCKFHPTSTSHTTSECRYGATLYHDEDSSDDHSSSSEEDDDDNSINNDHYAYEDTHSQHNISDGEQSQQSISDDDQFSDKVSDDDNNNHNF